ncbi:PLP-dependent aminotransferase family protein [Xenorhabdus hominickii]|nr:PLP-dependent aminotransferase family protein [Xenorhabdus hominickii]AOM41496.1 GntR family transcriptional regulator [Xenorhabdus hominickii]
MNKPLELKLDRLSKTPLTEQIRIGITNAIEKGVLKSGARLPSWLDLAAQLGVSRGTVRIAYERLMDNQLITASRSTGTRVVERPNTVIKEQGIKPSSFMDMYKEFTAGPAIFQMGVPSQENLPIKLFSRIRSYGIHAELGTSISYPDPCGELGLRREIASYLAISRGIACSPFQIIITNGFAGALGLTLKALGIEGEQAWIENPCFPLTRKGLELGKLSIVPVPVDKEGLIVEQGITQAPNAALAIVTPGQQAPLGYTLSLERRLQLLNWASKENAWIIEDDYLSELRLEGRATPALASLDQAGRVIHIGSFSKTLSPSLRLGFIVVPLHLVNQFSEIAVCLSPAPGPAVQLATSEFMKKGHYMRHIRRTKRLYLTQRNELMTQLQARNNSFQLLAGGLSVLINLPQNVDDVSLVRKMVQVGLAPAPLSVWYDINSPQQKGLLLGVAMAPIKHLSRACDQLIEAINIS